jgi:hypothetical protein
VKKLPVIGLIIGAIAAAYALMRRKKGDETPEDMNPGQGPGTGTTGTE